MKTPIASLRFILISIAPLLMAQHLSAQQSDTLVVEWAKLDNTIRINALHDAVMGDTVSGGTRKNLTRVYRLKRGGVYWNTKRLVNSNFPLRLIGEEPGVSASDHPAVVQLAYWDGDDGVPNNGQLLTGVSDVTLMNLWFIGRDTLGTQVFNQPIQFNGDNSRVEIDGCIFERSSSALIAIKGKDNNIEVRDCLFRNLLPTSSQWEGRGISILNNEKSLLVENCTFFNVGFTALYVDGGSVNTLFFVHNTLVNIGRNAVHGMWWQQAYFVNNLVINGWWEGEGFRDLHARGRDPRMIHNGLFTVDALPSSLGPELGRRIVIANTYAYLDPKISSNYELIPAADTITRAWFVDPVSKLDCLIPFKAGGNNGGHMFVGDTVWLSNIPEGMNYYLNDPYWLQPKYSISGATLADSMWKNISTLRADTTLRAPQYVYHPTKSETDYPWPLPESFAYTQSNILTAGTDGLPIGDLNWFPAQKAIYLDTRDEIIDRIIDLAGHIVCGCVFFLPVEAESGTVGGSATVRTIEGLTYYEYNGTGSITWNFNVTHPGLYDTRWLVYMNGRAQSGPCLAVNGVEFVDRALGWGQFVFDPTQGPAKGLSNNAWVWVPIVADSVKLASNGCSASPLFTLAADSNSLGVVNGGWGQVRFAEVDLIGRGTPDTIKLKAPDAIAPVAQPGAVGITWVPSRFKYVALGTNGTITVDLTAERNGTYHLYTFYQNVGPPEQLNISEGSTTLANVLLAAKADSSGLASLSSSFALTKGVHRISLSGANVNVDYVELLQEISGGVQDDDQLPPIKFSLEQNYPNPFNPATVIRYRLNAASRVTLKVFDLLGQEVATLVNGERLAGEYTINWDATRFSSGVYFYQLRTGAVVETKRMMIVR